MGISHDVTLVRGWFRWRATEVNDGLTNEKAKTARDTGASSPNPQNIPLWPGEMFEGGLPEAGLPKVVTFTSLIDRAGSRNMDPAMLHLRVPGGSALGMESDPLGRRRVSQVRHVSLDQIRRGLCPNVQGERSRPNAWGVKIVDTFPAVWTTAAAQTKIMAG